MLLLIAIKNGLSGPLSLILWVSLNKPLLGKDAAKWQSINSLLFLSTCSTGVLEELVCTTGYVYAGVIVSG